MAFADLALTVLVAAAEPDDRVGAVSVLTAAGHRVAAEADAAGALRRLSQGLAADVLVADEALAGTMDGGALAHVVSLCRPEVAIVLCSARAAGDAPPAGAVFVYKPYPPQALLRVVERLAARRAEAASTDGRAERSARGAAPGGSQESGRCPPPQPTGRPKTLPAGA